MRRMIPSTLSLIAFEAAARHQSFSRAAEELCHTQSAIGRQIGALEAMVGLKLFHRAKRRVTLTEAGHAYWQQVRAYLGNLEADTLDLIARQGKGGKIELAVLPTFATQWLIPRLASFTGAHPDVVINLATRTRPFLFEDTGFDAAIHFGDPVWPGARVEYLFGEEVVPVCSPALLAGRPAGYFARHPARLAELALLHQSTRLDAWRDWFRVHTGALEAETRNMRTGHQFELFSMLVQAAICGMGVALVPRFLVQDALDQGRLLVPVEPGLRGTKAYYLVFPENRADAPLLLAFRDWLQHETLAYRAQADGWPAQTPAPAKRRARRAGSVTPAAAAPGRARRSTSSPA